MSELRAALLHGSPWQETKFPARDFEIVSDEYLLMEESLDISSKVLFAFEEIDIYRHFSRQNSSHPGYRHVRTALDAFRISRAGGDYQCLVQKPVWDSFSEIVHTDIKAAETFIELDDEEVLDGFVEGEMRYPGPRKLGNRLVYVSCMFGMPDRWGSFVPGNFGGAVEGEEMQTHDAQPDVYRYPEVMLKTEWTYPADIWNVGAMDLYENKHLFYGSYPDGRGYKTAAHLAEVVARLGPPPRDLLERGLRSKYSSTKTSCEITLAGQEQYDSLGFVRCMLQWRPKNRVTAKQVLDHPWLKAPKSMEL
ncbi:uncharacterized protein M421DRAFT_395449 [Didymella exigua CBS 183.55]|uniref:Protein kinase domain-containing protein n=1 Tax=Didymella exigua CBS 183.55 TaxID=1150837 RepID=A0A6A5RYJ0_9PLEO|nr:uncharacterized protein M421DRAFT_395449 [Didymella exigua CBS 183.55]KAF1933451.1 hypothetical protein M421DRAFT_395449 [Didymella exigua CBS 183.55]